MRLLIGFLLVTSSVTVLALDPYLKSSSGSKCYYTDGSVIDNGGLICPRQLSVNNGKSAITAPNLGPSQESIDWRLKYGQDRAQGLNISTNNLLQLALQKRRQAEAAKLANQSRTNRTISPTTPQKSPIHVTQKHLGFSVMIEEGMSMFDVKGWMGAPDSYIFIDYNQEWHYCSVQNRGADYFAIKFKSNIVQEFQRYSVVSGNTSGAIDDCEKFIKMGSYKPFSS